MKRFITLAALAVALPVAAQAEKMADGAVQFTVRIENVSKADALRSADGATAPAPNSPGLWVVHTKPARLFQSGKTDLGWGLEAQAEDGNPEKLAEHCKSHEGVVASGIFNTPVGDAGPGPALPGKAYEFTVMAKPGERLSLVTMFGQSNDWFYAPDEKGIALFNGNKPVSGDVTKQLALWEAGTEVDEAPGFGPNQAPRQSGPNTGPSEARKVAKVKSKYQYPGTSDVLKVTITPGTMSANR